jgi:hypothetical protein
MENAETHLSMWLFGREISNKFLQRKKSVRKSKYFDAAKVKSLDMNDTRVKVWFGLNEPHLTGIVQGFLCIFGSFLNIESFELAPDFLPADTYLRLEAKTNLNLGNSAVRLIKAKTF